MSFLTVLLLQWLNNKQRYLLLTNEIVNLLLQGFVIYDSVKV